MSLAKQRGIYSTPEKWERVRRRARKNNETISRFGERCCRRAAEALGAPPSAPPGHPLALPEDDQRRLLAHSLAVERGMDRRGRRADALALLRRAFGDEAAQTVAAAFMPTAPAPASAAPAESPESSGAEAPPEAAPQGEPFDTGDD